MKLTWFAVYVILQQLVDFNKNCTFVCRNSGNNKFIYLV